MKVAIIGGGPAGLYSAILLKKQRPEADVTVYERNRPDDTFGFGVVFSDATLVAISDAQPGTRSALGQISGVGPAKLDRYAVAVLALLGGADPESVELAEL